MSKYRTLILQIVAGLAVMGVIGFIAIQFVPVDKSNPPVVNEPRWDSPQTKMLVERACYDCHSNQTKWPWYANVAPASWLVAHDVQEGRVALNFSEWGIKGAMGEGNETVEAGEAEENESDEGEEAEGGESAEPDEIIEEVEEGAMPPRKYVVMHPEAKLTHAEIEALIAGFKATFGSQSEGAMVK